jgi:multidrug efflux pump subunit AcrB
VRHYYLREGLNRADIQVNLISKHERREQSHDIAKSLRPGLEIIASKYGAKIKVAEIPPGPPVLQTLVAEVYGPDYENQVRLAREILKIFQETRGVVDADWYMDAPQKEWNVRVEKDKALSLGISPERVMAVLKTSFKGAVAGLFHDKNANEDVPVMVRLPIEERSDLASLKDIRIRSLNGNTAGLNEVASITETSRELPVYHKNLKPVVYVTADVAGEEESPVYAILELNKKLRKLKTPSGTDLDIFYTSQPFTEKDWAIKWDGEWHITYEVFRDMGGAFGIVVILIYVLVVGWFRSYTIPFVILSPIPLSLIGIIPAHALKGAFFTATSMIGFIAGAGIVVRNSIILVDFIELRLKEGMALADAVVDAGAVRFRPMLLTSSAVVVGSFVILFDPIFQGLAISLMAGEIAATLFSRMVVPILYYLDHRIKAEKRLVF